MPKRETGSAQSNSSVYLTSLGCRLNESEIEAMAAQFDRAGWRIVAEPDQADVCVVNTCTVTGEAGRKSRQRVRRLHRLNPDAAIVVTGCHATLFPQEIERIEGVSRLVPNPGKASWVEDLVGELAAPAEEGQPGPALLGRTRPFVKVQDGCENHCTFCITRVARGAGRSRPSDQVLTEVGWLVQAGYQEVVLTGVNLGSYGRDREEADGLFHLVRRLLAETSLPRLRLSSLEPWDLSPDFFDLWELGAGRLCRQLHLPLQSGCDATLRRMGRRITRAQFADLVALARQRVPGLAVTTDMMVGFPGESQAEFEQSYRFAQDLAFARVHVFSYSPRPGTAAARLPEPVPAKVTAARSRRLRQLARDHARDFRRRFVGQVWPVLWHGPPRAGAWRGLTDNYLPVETTCAADLDNRILPTRLVRLGKGVLEGEITDLEAGHAG